MHFSHSGVIWVLLLGVCVNFMALNGTVILCVHQSRTAVFQLTSLIRVPEVAGSFPRARRLGLSEPAAPQLEHEHKLAHN